MIESRTVAVAECDCCGHVHYGDDDGMFHAGYALAVTAYNDWGPPTSHNVYACRQTHIGKAAKVVLDREAPGGDETPADNGSSTADSPEETHA